MDLDDFEDDEDCRPLPPRECFNEAAADLGFTKEELPLLLRAKSDAEYTSLSEEQYQVGIGRLYDFTQNLNLFRTPAQAHEFMRYRHPDFNNGQSIADCLLAGTDETHERAVDVMEFRLGLSPGLIRQIRFVPQ